jgi:hypothetical protein
MGDRNIRVPGWGETMAETGGIYAYTPAACVEQARLAGVYTAEAIARRGEISARIRVARALESSCTAAPGAPSTAAVPNLTNVIES